MANGGQTGSRSKRRYKGGFVWFVDSSEVCAHLGPYYSNVGPPSIDPERMVRMLTVRYGLAIRSERRLCEEARLNLACRWFRRLGLDGDPARHRRRQVPPRPAS
jgi:hypothetical protein